MMRFAMIVIVIAFPDAAAATAATKQYNLKKKNEFN